MSEKANIFLTSPQYTKYILYSMKKNHSLIVRFLISKKNVGVDNVSTREIADSIELTIYQARQQLEYLCQYGVVERISMGRGRPTMWRIPC